MATVSARVEDKTKIEAEQIANSIGITLSTAINVFLNRFIADQGFPFSVVNPKKGTTILSLEELESIVKKSIINHKDDSELPPSMYIDPKDNKIKYTQ